MNSSVRTVVPLCDDWKFTRTPPSHPSALNTDDSDWQNVRVPHDWAIAGPFDKEHDIQRTMIIEDGDTQVREHTGRTGALPHIGLAWYRRHFFLPEEARGKRVWIQFDGVMSHSTVYLNSRSAGSWPYGYTSFQFDLTNHARFGEENVLAVRVDNPPRSSRWYPGAGIYRNVRLVLVDPIHVAHNGVYITTPKITDASATVRVRTEIYNRSGAKAAVRVETTIVDPNGERVESASTRKTIGVNGVIDQKIMVPKPQRWDLHSPRLYSAITQVVVGDTVVDEVRTTFGIRKIDFSARKGFSLNGRIVRLNGVCMHHDLGALGTAVSRTAIRRQLEILKEMGCNAIRTSHNPPAPELPELCDMLGILVIDEAFDEWTLPKAGNGYNLLFHEWADKDLTAMIRRDRNHPCVIMWSIGNEIGEQRHPGGVEVAKYLHDICHREDPTRPTTAGFNSSDDAIACGMADVVDVPGWNYKPHKYRSYHADHPTWPMYGSETSSCVSSRGEYWFPVRELRDPVHESLQGNSYDLNAPSWAYGPEYEFAALDDCTAIMGEFVWTGFDYLGEPTPYNTQWPSRSSYFGIVDLAGIPKDRYYLYRSRWAPEKETLHLLPHWTWPGREGQPTPVFCYTNHPAAELFLNGRSLGVRRKEPAGLRPGEVVPEPREAKGMAQLINRYRLVWDDVPYDPGVLKVVALDKKGAKKSELEMRTAGDPARIELSIDRDCFDEQTDLAFVTVSIVDADGTVCPHADNEVRFSLEGPGELAGVDNGDPTSLESFQANTRKAFHGKCVAIIRWDGKTWGEIRLKAESAGLKSAEISFKPAKGQAKGA